MTKDKFESTRNLIVAIARMIELIPLREFIYAIEHAETLAPIIDPTLYRAYIHGEGQHTNNVLVELAEKMLEIQVVAERKLQMKEADAPGGEG